MSSGLTGTACTDEQRLWNSGTQRNLAPKLLADISFAHHKPMDAFQKPDVRASHLPLPPIPVDDMRKGLHHVNLHVSSLLHKCLNATPQHHSAIAPQSQQCAAHVNHDSTNTKMWKIRITASSAKKVPIGSNPDIFFKKHPISIGIQQKSMVRLWLCSG